MDTIDGVGVPSYCSWRWGAINWLLLTAGDGALEPSTAGWC